MMMIKIFILTCLLLFNSSVSGGADYFKGSTAMEELTNTPYHKVMTINLMKGRKLMNLQVDATLDYHDPVANPIHDPKKGN
ncbi:hypothetical protein L484_007825 [Morus notabilis]|uniref:Uncharacterized protein n=1 Tax=Morus notabilis TaxID=981085 RepID=W9SKT7_9ROSA|nr:hypothetical protein L484_007825 [Morus notabilis]